MAKSRFEYVRNFELPDPLLLSTHIVVRIDGRAFHKFSQDHEFDKPNDVRAIELMDRAARGVMEELGDVVLAFGESDEYSFLFKKDTSLHSRRRSKINSAVVSIFTSNYVFHWSTYFPSTTLLYPPSFDSRVVLYPSVKEVRDYFSWRQADNQCERSANDQAHINNLYNTAFWALVKGGMSTKEANKALQGTDSGQKNELLFAKFGINYNKEPARFRKGSVLVRAPEQLDKPLPVIPQQPSESSTLDSTPPMSTRDTNDESDQTALPSLPDLPARDAESKGKKTSRLKAPKPFDGLTGQIVILHDDIIGDQFWLERPWLVQ